MLLLNKCLKRWFSIRVLVILLIFYKEKKLIKKVRVNLLYSEDKRYILWIYLSKVI